MPHRRKMSDHLMTAPAVSGAELTPPASEHEFVAMTFNIAHGRGTRFHQTLVSRVAMERNLAAIARHIQQYDPHIVVLQEVDQGSFWNHHVDQLEYLQALTHYSHARHGIHKHDSLLFNRWVLKYGVGILSRLEPLDFFSQPFSLGRLDSKGFTTKRLQFGDRRLLTVGLHLDFQRNSRRMVQVEQIIAHVQSLEGSFDHVLVLGDFNCTVQESGGALRRLMDALQLVAFEPERSDEHISFPGPGFLARRLDYILIDRGLSFVDYITGTARLSDHEYVVAKIRVG